MAKVKLPLISLEARGAIGKALVYFPWKGINAVREYVIPANPQTELQLAQRARITAAILDVHTANFNTFDLAALRTYASIQPKIMTGINTFVKKHVLNSIADKGWILISEATLVTLSSVTIALSIHSPDTSTLMQIAWGHNPRWLPNIESMSYIPGDDRWVWSLSFPVSKAKYYFKMYQVGGVTYGEMGIYSVTAL